MAEPEQPPDLTPDNPFLRVIRDEALRIPGGMLVAQGHVSDVLGAAVGTPEGDRRLLEFCHIAGLAVEHDQADGLRFTPEPGPAPTPAA